MNFDSILDQDNNYWTYLSITFATALLKMYITTNQSIHLFCYQKTILKSRSWQKKMDIKACAQLCRENGDSKAQFKTALQILIEDMR